jgi:hypothetical protein
MEDFVNIRRSFSSRGATNALLAAICALLVLQLVASHADLLLPRRLLAEDAHQSGQPTAQPPARPLDEPSPVYLVAGPSGGRVDMLPVALVYLDQKGMLGNVVAPDGSVRVQMASPGTNH